MQSEQLTIAEILARAPAEKFHGSDYQPELDEKRLTDQIHRIFNFMKSGDWHTLGEIEAATGYPQASISAQLRHLVNLYGHKKEKRRRGNEKRGLWEYRILANGPLRLKKDST